MAYDSVRKQVILFGGWQGDIYDDTWAWDGATWNRLTPQTSPSPRFYHRMVHDAEHGQIVLFGGLDSSAAANDTWIWNGTNWILKMPANSPPTRFGEAMVYHSAGRRTILFGGHLSSTDSIASDTWAWDGTNWTQLAPLDSPADRTYATAAYDAPREKVLLFGGTTTSMPFDDTWTFTLGAGCAFSTPIPEISVPALGGASSVPIQLPAGCPWSATTATDWIALLNVNGTSNGAVTFTASQNTFYQPRIGYINVNGRQYAIRQPEAPCPTGGALREMIVYNGCAVNLTYTAKAGDSIALRGTGRANTYGPRDRFFDSFPSISVHGPAPANTLIASATGRDDISTSDRAIFSSS